MFAPSLFLVHFINATGFQDPQISAGTTTQHLTCAEFLNMHELDTDITSRNF